MDFSLSDWTFWVVLFFDIFLLVMRDADLWVSSYIHMILYTYDIASCMTHDARCVIHPQWICAMHCSVVSTHYNTCASPIILPRMISVLRCTLYSRVGRPLHLYHKPHWPFRLHRDAVDRDYIRE
jgi:hypothetical protein